MTYPGTQQPGTGTDIRNDTTTEPSQPSTPGGVDHPEQDERSPGSGDGARSDDSG